MKIIKQNKSAGQILFESYNSNNTGEKRNGRYVRISNDYLPVTWRDLSKGDKLNWEKIASSTDSLIYQRG